MSTQANAITDDASLASQSAIVDTATDAAATSTADEGQTDAGDVAQTTDQQTDQQVTQDGQQDQTTLDEDGRKIPAHIKALKEANPEAYRRAKTDHFDLSARRSLHPTLQAAREEHEIISSVGGKQGLAQMREDQQFLKTQATNFLKGSREFYESLWDKNLGGDPVAAALGLSHMLELASKHDPASYKPTLARLWDNEFQAVGFAPALKNLRTALAAKDFDSATRILESINGWSESISNVARQAEDPRVKSLLAERSQRVENEEKTQREEFLNSYKTDTLNAVVEDAGKVFDSFFKGRKIDSDDRTDLLREVMAAANRVVAADKEFIDQREAHLKANDKNSAMRLTQARFNRAFPEAVKRIARRYGYVSGTATPPPAKQNATPGTAPAAASQGFVKVNVRPNPDDIDRSKSDKAMLFSGRAILKNGRKIDWSGLRQTA